MRSSIENIARSFGPITRVFTTTLLPVENWDDTVGSQVTTWWSEDPRGGITTGKRYNMSILVYILSRMLFPLVGLVTICFSWHNLLKWLSGNWLSSPQSIRPDWGCVWRMWSMAWVICDCSTRWSASGGWLMAANVRQVKYLGRHCGNTATQTDSTFSSVNSVHNLVRKFEESHMYKITPPPLIVPGLSYLKLE